VFEVDRRVQHGRAAHGSQRDLVLAAVLLVVLVCRALALGGNGPLVALLGK